jgi:hypothetical protein
MGLRTSNFSTAILISLLWLVGVCSPLSAQQQNGKGQATAKSEHKSGAATSTEEYVPTYCGLYIGADLYGIGSKLLGGDMLSSDISFIVNIKNKFMPTLEAGFGTTDAWNDSGEGINYKSTSPYFRIGLDYNLMAKKKNKNSYMYLGARYGISPMTFDVHTAPLTDPIYGGEIANPALNDYIWGGTVPYDYPGQKATLQWFEFVLGVRVQIYKNFFMGWALRMKYKLSESLSEHGNPWMVPGYGKYDRNNLGVSYSIIYRIPHSK